MHVDTARSLSLLASAVYVPEDHGLVHCAGCSQAGCLGWLGRQDPGSSAPRPLAPWDGRSQGVRGGPYVEGPCFSATPGCH